jgi:hypothetical protein
MTLPRDMLIAIGRAVHQAGGQMTDVDDLVAVWQRLAADRTGRVDRMRAEASDVDCGCADGGEARPDGRCNRCYGRVRNCEASQVVLDPPKDCTA